ncbi:MAG: hypothetical protein OET90_02025 [Desulfuromonadales bacterium]|nr:hypothetical protein [Desulfuromonadales bacterium]
MNSQVAKPYNEIWKDLIVISGLFNAVSTLPCLVEPESEELWEVKTMLEHGCTQTKEVSLKFADFDESYDGLVSRVNWRPQPGDPVPAALIAALMECILSAEHSTDWFHSVADVATGLNRYAKIYPELKPSVETLLELARQRDGDLRIEVFGDNQERVAFYGCGNGAHLCCIGQEGCG